MTEKIKQAVATLIANLPKLKVAGGNLWIIYLALLLLFGSIVLYLGSWIWLFFAKSKADLNDLREIIVILCGAPFVAALCFLTKSAVDKDGDGISDSLTQDTIRGEHDDKGIYQSRALSKR